MILRYMAVLLALAAIGFAARAAWIPAKALLAQAWLDQAFAAAVIEGEAVAPWSWADFKVAGQLTGLGNAIIPVLDRASGQALAFGAGWHEENQGKGPVVLSGHRDTHFAGLRDLEQGAALTLAQPDGEDRFRVTDTVLVDTRKQDLQVPLDAGLVLITCWPFGATDPDTPWRFVVLAEKMQR